MDTSALTGLLVIAGLLVFVFSVLPAMRRRGQVTDAVRETSRQIRETARVELTARTQAIKHTSYSREELAVRALRIGGARRFLGLTTLAGLLVAGFSAIDFAHLWAVVAGGAGTAIVSLVANRSLAARQLALLADQRVARVNPMFPTAIFTARPLQLVQSPMPHRWLMTAVGPQTTCRHQSTPVTLEPSSSRFWHRCRQSLPLRQQLQLRRRWRKIVLLANIWMKSFDAAGLFSPISAIRGYL